MLWDLIRDFFVQHIFGGTATNGNVYDANIGWAGNANYDANNFNDVVYQIGHIYDGTPAYMSASDWLSTTATIISITIIVVLCCLFVYKIIKLIGGLIR